MGIIVDIIIIAIIALSTFLSYRKGIVEVAISFCAFVISIVATFLLYQPISNVVIQTTNIDETIEKAIYEKASESMTPEKEGANPILEITQNEMLPETARNIAVSMVRAGVSLILFIGIKIALKFISALADVITKLPIIKQLNQTGGIIYGIGRGILIVFATLLIVGMLQPIWSDNVINQSVEQSIIGKAMDQNNVLGIFMGIH